MVFICCHPLLPLATLYLSPSPFHSLFLFSFPFTFQSSSDQVVSSLAVKEQVSIAQQHVVEQQFAVLFDQQFAVLFEQQFAVVFEQQFAIVFEQQLAIFFKQQFAIVFKQQLAIKEQAIYTVPPHRGTAPPRYR